MTAEKRTRKCCVCEAFEMPNNPIGVEMWVGREMGRLYEEFEKEYSKKLVTHTYCPPCARKMKSEVEEFLGGQ